MIELYTTRQLLDELLARFDHAVFAGLKIDEGIERQYELRDAKGNTRTCQGLALGVIARCEQQREAVAEPTEGD